MSLVRALFALHLLALFFGLLGLLVALPHPQLWSGSALAARIFAFGMSHGGTTHILFGAATMLAFGACTIGARQTLVFFAAGTLLPLGAELLGTGTGWPFGGYAYTDFLGAKIAGRVPYSVPLSWFYMGFACYLLARLIVARGPARHAWPAIVLGAWLLMAWDLTLDPALASAAMPIRFWTWHEHGPYFGMPLRNLAGWFGTGLAFMALARLLWRGEPVAARIPRWLPFGVYVANVLWAMALSSSAGLWPATLAALALGLVPASLVWRGASWQAHARRAPDAADRRWERMEYRP